MFKICLFFVLLFLFGAGFVYALEINYPNLPNALAPQNFINSAPPEQIPGLFIKYIVYLIIWVSLFIGFCLLVIAGFRYIFFSLSPQGKASARNQISSVVFGLLILFSSILLLETINPQILVFDLPKLESIIVTNQRSSLIPPPSEKPKTLINVELPFGPIIEKRIFETEGNSPRLNRITNIASDTLSVSQGLVNQGLILASSTQKCSCSYTSVKDENYCTCDPCKEERTLIQAAEIENLKLIGIKMGDSPENYIEPYNLNLISEQKKAIEETRLLKEEIDKLNRVENFMLKCPLWTLTSLTNYETDKDYYQANDQILLHVKFWREILIDPNYDYHIFYCPVSGTITGLAFDFSFEDIELPKDFPEPAGAIEKSSCEEIPVGKIIDRSKRLAEKMVERLEKLTHLNKQMVNATSQLHVLISQCTSQNCTVRQNEDGSKYCNGDNDPCPSGMISDQINRIQNIYREIKIVVEGEIPDILKYKLNEAERENIGIIPIIKEVVPGLLKDLEKEVRIGNRKMQGCVTDVPPEGEEEPSQPSIILSSCEIAVRSTSEGKVIEQCHLTMEEQAQKAFNKCLSQCYFESSYDVYKTCLEECIAYNTGIDIEEAKTWFHSADFFCCGK